MYFRFLLAGQQRLFQTTLELAPVNQSGQCIMRSLMRHLRDHLARLSHIAEHEDNTDDAALAVAYRASGIFNRKFSASTLDENNVFTDRSGLLLLQHLVDRIG